MNNQIKVAFLGLGVMGGAMSANLARHGYEVKAWNRTSNRPGVEVAQAGGAAIVSSIREAVQDAEVVFTCVGDVPDVKEVILGVAGVINYAPEQTLVVDMSTIGRDCAVEVAQQLQQRNLRFMDAPVSGGDVGAQQGTLTIMVGGEEKDFQQCLPLFEAMGKTIRLCGGVGSGQAVKMCNQVLCSLHMVALCEAIQMAQHLEIDPNLIVEVCSTGAAGSWALSQLGPKIIESDFEPGFMIKHILKDLRLVEAAADSNSLDLPGMQLAYDLFKQTAKLDKTALEQGTQAMIRAYQ